MQRLSPRQETFIREWLVDQNATRAAKAAGYAEANAHVEGCRLLRHPKVKPLIEAALAERARVAGEGAEARARKWSEKVESIAYAPCEDGPPPPQQVKALELLGKHLGLLVDRQRHEGADGGQLVIEVKTYKREG